MGKVSLILCDTFFLLQNPYDTFSMQYFAMRIAGYNTVEALRSCECPHCITISSQSVKNAFCSMNEGGSSQIGGGVHSPFPHTAGSSSDSSGHWISPLHLYPMLKHSLPFLHANSVLLHAAPALPGERK
jgi:hypothetical protein